MSDSSNTSQTPRRSPTKTLALWFVMIGLFLAFYAHFSGDTRLAWCIGKTTASVPIVLVLLWVFFFQARHFRRDDRWAMAREAARLEGNGQLDEAAREWERIAHLSLRNSTYRVDFILRHAWVALRQGQGKQAMQLLEPVLSRPDARERELAHALLALVMGLRGHLPRTESLLNGLQDESLRRGVVGGVASQVLLLRRGEFDTALALAVPPWDIADAHSHHLRRVWALLRAFTLEQLPPTPQLQRDAVRTRAELRDVRPGEFDYLTAQWPELGDFLAQRVAAVEPGATPDAANSTASPQAAGDEGPQAFTSAAFGLGLPARWDPLRQGSVVRRSLFLLALLGGFAYLLFLKGTSIGLEVALLVVLVLATIVGLWMPWLLESRGTARNKQGIGELNAGRPDEAARLFDEVLEKSQGGALFQYRQGLLFNRATAFFHTGERAMARRIYHALAHQCPRTTPVRVRAFSWEALAECEALDGNLERAWALKALAGELWQGQEPHLGQVTSLVLALREGDPEAAADEAEAMLGKPRLVDYYRRRVVLLHAFALEQVKSPTPEQQEERAQLQEQLRQQAVPGEFDYLATEWPELRAFLDKLGTARAAA